MKTKLLSSVIAIIIVVTLSILMAKNYETYSQTTIMGKDIHYIEINQNNINIHHRDGIVESYERGDNNNGNNTKIKRR